MLILSSPVANPDIARTYDAMRDFVLGAPPSLNKVAIWTGQPLDLQQLQQRVTRYNDQIFRHSPEDLRLARLQIVVKYAVQVTGDEKLMNLTLPRAEEWANLYNQLFMKTMQNKPPHYFARLVDYIELEAYWVMATYMHKNLDAKLTAYREVEMTAKKITDSAPLNPNPTWGPNEYA